MAWRAPDARRRRARWLQALLIATGAWLSSGCLFHTHEVKKHGVVTPLKTANAAQLVEIINKEANAIRTVNATVDLVASTGGERSGKVIEYRSVTAYLLVSKPSAIRLIGQLSIVGTLFDMASNGTDFELSVPPRNKFFVGRNNVVPRKTSNPLERLRPQVILQALLINPIAAGNHVVITDDLSEDTPRYDLLVETPGSPTGDVVVDHLLRKMIFSRVDLLPREQLIYDYDGNVATQATYAQFQTVDGVNIPYQLTIKRPAEEYSISMTVQKVKLNTAIGGDKFTITQPPGSQRVVVSDNRLPAPRNSVPGNERSPTEEGRGLAEP